MNLSYNVEQLLSRETIYRPPVPGIGTFVMTYVMLFNWLIETVLFCVHLACWNSNICTDIKHKGVCTIY